MRSFVLSLQRGWRRPPLACLCEWGSPVRALRALSGRPRCTRRLLHPPAPATSRISAMAAAGGPAVPPPTSRSSFTFVAASGSSPSRWSLPSDSVVAKALKFVGWSPNAAGTDVEAPRHEIAGAAAMCSVSGVMWALLPRGSLLATACYVCRLLECHVL